MANELATGSVLAEDGETIVDVTGIEITAIASRKVVVIEDIGDDETIEAYAKDVLVAIDRAGLDPVRTAARELVELCKPVTMHSDGGRRSIIETAEKLKALL